MTDILYTIKRHRRARRINISVHHTGNIVVTLPLHAPVEYADRFVQSKSAWIFAARARMQKRFANKVPLKQSRREYKELKSKTLAFIKERLTYFNTHYQFSYKRISIRMQKSRWGSCSRKGNLNFNYTLVKIPQKLADYIIVHELCHLKEMNHGENFWNLVAETIPDHKERRKILKDSYVHISP